MREREREGEWSVRTKNIDPWVSSCLLPFARTPLHPSMDRSIRSVNQCVAAGKIAVGCLDDVSRAPMPRKFEITATKEVVPSFLSLLALSSLEQSQPHVGTTPTDLEPLFFPSCTKRLVVGAQVAAGPLDASRPGAVTTESMRGIVVSRETVGGARWINRERVETEKYPALAIVAVNLVGAASQDPGAKKLSSSDLRDREAARKRRNVSHSSSGEGE